MFSTAAARREGTSTAQPLPAASWRKPGPITPGRRLAKTLGAVLRPATIDGSRGMGPGFRQDDAGVLDGSLRRLTTAAALLRRVPHFGALGPRRAELELRDLAERIE